MRQRKGMLLFRIVSSLFLLLLIDTSSSHAQEVISYVTKRKTSVKHAKGEEKLFTDFDRLNMRSYEEVDSVIISVSENGEFVTTIFHLSTTKLSDWVDKPMKTIIDKKGIRTYNEKGKNITELLHDKVALQSYKQFVARNKERGYNNIPAFEEIPEADIQKMKAKGSLIKKGNNGEFHIRDKNKELLYDIKNKIVENREFDKDNILVYSIKQQFKVNEKGETIPFHKREVTLKRTERGLRLWYFSDETTFNYKHEKLIKPKKTNFEANLNIVIYPNPATTIVTIEVPTEILLKKPTVILFDMVGNEVSRHSISKTNESLPVSSLVGGTYMLQIVTNDGSKRTFKFIKN